ncbi:MAG TPA: lytic transglycosylase F [Myxococcaceae bacterium]|nr:lytic transglycosylase F [Myxococcaceae bacterium]
MSLLPARAAAQPDAGSPDPFLDSLSTLMRPWKGDFDAMKERRLLRALVVYSRTYYFVDQGTQHGVSYEALKAFEAEINRQLGKRKLPFNIVFVPVTRDEIIPALLAGMGDLAAAGLTITPERQKLVDFSVPVASGVREVAVTGPGTPPLARIEDLAGRAVHVRRSSSYWEHLEDLNRRFAAQGRPPMKLVAVHEDLEDEDVLEMVNAGLVPLTVVDRFKVLVWKDVLHKLAFEPEVAVSTDNDLAWMLRKGSPKLKAVVDAFVRTHRQGTEFGNVLINRYEKSSRYLKEATSPAELRKYRQTVDLFRKYSGRYDVDYLLMLAQGYQESRLDQEAKSSVGAVGIMQLMPVTGEQMAVGDIHQLEANIHAGVKYMRYVQDTYFAGEPMDPLVKHLFAFASYNAGPGRIHELRKDAARRGLDPNRWFRNVEVVAADKIGQETVTYVSNIFKYYVAYRLLADEEVERARSLQEEGLQPR